MLQIIDTQKYKVFYKWGFYYYFFLFYFFLFRFYGDVIINSKFIQDLVASRIGNLKYSEL